jgi:hypothetical protein
VDLDLLHEFASQGFAAVPADRLPELIGSCRNAVDTTAEPSFAILEDVLTNIAAWWPDQGAPSAIVGELDSLCREYVPQILNASGVEAVRAARDLERQVTESVRIDWHAAGLVRGR